MDAQALAAERHRDFELNCEKYRRHVYYIMLGKTRNKAVAEEITQETLLRFIAHMNKWRWEKEIRHVNAFLTKIAKRLCADQGKRPKEEVLVTNDDEQSDHIRKALERKAMEENDPTSRYEDDIHYQELLRQVPLKTILGGLTKDEQRLFEMDVVGEMTNQEIADAFGREVEWARYQVNKLRAKIRYRAKSSD